MALAGLDHFHYHHIIILLLWNDPYSLGLAFHRTGTCLPARIPLYLQTRYDGLCHRPQRKLSRSGRLPGSGTGGVGTCSDGEAFFVDDNYRDWTECGGGDLPHRDHPVKVGMQGWCEGIGERRRRCR